jgi:hypothetical protein
MSIALEITRDEVAQYMDKILKKFKPGAKITVLVRSPLIPGDTGFLMTNDDLQEVLIAVQRRQEQEKSKPASPT